MHGFSIISHRLISTHKPRLLIKKTCLENWIDSWLQVLKVVTNIKRIILVHLPKLPRARTVPTYSHLATFAKESNGVVGLEVKRRG